MDMNNKTIATEFVLLGFSEDLNINIGLFVLFFMVYFITIIGNSIITLLIVINHELHIPMYFFLSNLSFIDVCNSSCSIPKMLVNLFSIQRTISLSACLIQVNVLLVVGATECLLLVLMAYDRCIAICFPLYYIVIMRWSTCYRLTAFVWVFTFMIIMVPSFAMPVTLCYPNQINHFMCEAPAVLKLSCDRNYFKEIVIFSISFVTILLPFVLILASYVCIISSILKMHCVGRSKAFSTCTSHITVVAMYFGAGMVSYLVPSRNYSFNKDKYVSIFYVIIAPMLNPLIYSLNNREIKRTFRKFFLKCAIYN